VKPSMTPMWRPTAPPSCRTARSAWPAMPGTSRTITDTSSLAVRTQGLLGEQFLALNLGFDDPELGSAMLKDGDTLRDTKSAMVLEDLIGQFLYKSGDNKQNSENKDAQEGDSAAPAAPAQP